MCAAPADVLASAKKSFGPFGGISAKICTHKNFPLYDVLYDRHPIQCHLMIRRPLPLLSSNMCSEIARAHVHIMSYLSFDEFLANQTAGVSAGNQRAQRLQRR